MADAATDTDPNYTPVPPGATRPGYQPPPVYQPSPDVGSTQPPPPQPMSDADVQGFIKQKQDITSESVNRLRGLDQQRMDLASQPTPHPAAPKLQDIPKPPDTQPLNVFKEAQPALIFTTVMGALAMRNHGMGAMAAATGFLQGWHDGDKERMDRERQKWNDSVDAIKSENDVQKSRYDAAWNDTTLTQSDRMAKISAIASSIGDEQTIHSMQAGNLDFAYKLQQDRNTAATKLYEINKKAINPQAYALQQYIAEGDANGTPRTAAQIQAFLQSGRSGRSALTMYMNSYIQDFQAKNGRPPSPDEIKTAAQTYTTQTLAKNRFLSGPQGNTIRSLNVVVSHLQTMQTLGSALKNGEFVAFNRIAQTVAEQTGQPAPTNFDTAKQIVGAEVIKALGVAGAGTQSERQEAADAFNRARSPEQLNQAIGVARQLLLGQLKGLKQQYVAATGLPAQSFDDMLSPETQQFFDESHPTNMSDDDLKKKLGIP